LARFCHKWNRSATWTASGAPVLAPSAYDPDLSLQMTSTGLSRDLLYDEMRRGHLDYIKVGRRRLITRQHLEQFLNITPALQPPILSSTTTGRKAAEDGR
jgi:excisionase family DNA binding protein